MDLLPSLTAGAQYHPEQVAKDDDDGWSFQDIPGYASMQRGLRLSQEKQTMDYIVKRCERQQSVYKTLVIEKKYDKSQAW